MANQFAPVGLVSHATTPSSHARECDCPPWVIRCAHFADGRYIGLRAPGIKTRQCSICKPSDETRYRFGGAYEMRYCPDCDSPQWLTLSRIYLSVHDSEADALAAFYAAEAELLR